LLSYASIIDSVSLRLADVRARSELLQQQVMLVFMIIPMFEFGNSTGILYAMKALLREDNIIETGHGCASSR
jgi:hypothetical protein